MENNQRSIKKARELFLKRGIMRRDCLREDVAYSWARSQLIHLDSTKQLDNIEPLEFFESQDEALEKWDMETLKEVVSQTQILAIVHFDKIGDLKKFWSHEKSFGSIDYSEKKLGANGIGLSQKFKKKKIFFGFEHYHESFSQLITIGIPLEDNGTVGFVLRKNGVKERDLIKWFQNLPEKLKLENDDRKSLYIEKKSSCEDLNLPACLVGNSPFIKNTRKRLNLFKEKPFFYISGASGMGKETLAYFLHKKSTRRNLKFHAVYCDKIPFNRFKQDWLQTLEEIDEKIKKEQIGTVYFESVEALPTEYQKKFLRILDSKAVNNNLEKDCKYIDFSFVVSTCLGGLQDEKKGKLLTSLQNRFGMVEIKLHSLNNRKEDVCLILEHMLNSNGMPFQSLSQNGNLLWEEIKRLVMRVEDWDNIRNLRAVEKIVSTLKSKSKLENRRLEIKEILQINDGKFNKDLNGTAALEKVEKETILKAMKSVDFNVTKASKILGVSRSTLYRKMKSYNIEKKSHNETKE